MDRPQLLGRTFDRVYIVKYLGLDAFTGYDLVKSEHVSQMRKSATKSQLKTVEKFTKEHYAAPNKKLFGIAKGRNVIVIHLESFQQFLIDKKSQWSRSYAIFKFAVSRSRHLCLLQLL